jgi:soluble lytic murein transglycosylase-like protein
MTRLPLRSVTLALLLAVPASCPVGRYVALARGTALPPASKLARCKGDTHAHVSIRWPSAADRAAVRRLRWSMRVPSLVRRWAYLIVADSNAAGVDPYLVAGVMELESHGDPLIWNLDSDARGLMQVLHGAFEPAINVRVGVSMLGALQRQFGSRDLVLAAYNAGPGSVQSYGGVPPFAETRDYVVLVDYYRDLYAGVKLSAARTARFNAAWADLVAHYRRICGTS